MMRILKGMLLSCLLFLHGCDSVYGQNSVYEQKNGAWYYDGRKIDVNQPGSFKPLKARFATGADGGYYHGSLIEGSDGASFEALDDNYARDKAHVYHCDTYRKGQDS